MDQAAQQRHVRMVLPKHDCHLQHSLVADVFVQEPVPELAAHCWAGLLPLQVPMALFQPSSMEFLPCASHHHKDLRCCCCGDDSSAAVGRLGCTTRNDLVVNIEGWEMHDHPLQERGAHLHEQTPEGAQGLRTQCAAAFIKLSWFQQAIGMGLLQLFNGLRTGQHEVLRNQARFLPPVPLLRLRLSAGPCCTSSFMMFMWWRPCPPCL